jgi:hypothetical protein
VDHIINEYIELGYDAMKGYFEDKSSYTDYIESFQNHEDAEDFIEACSYLYRIIKQKDDSIRIILFISLIEKVTAKNFEDFTSWINTENGKEILTQTLTTNEDVKEIIRILLEEYNQKYGARNNFANFIEKFASKDDQFRLILLFRGWRKETVYKYSSRLSQVSKDPSIPELKAKGHFIDNLLMPKCYDWRMCLVELGSCIPEAGCLVKEDQKKFKEAIRAVAKLIYDMRSEIVHAASSKSLIRKGGGLVYAGSINLVNGKPVLIEMTQDELERIFTDALKNYFDRRSRSTEGK